jgi:ABC-type transport system involved in multi-copper enzyme maturation permease subunit
LRLLRIYLLSFIAAIFICFAVSAVSNLMLAWAGDELELVEDTKTLFSSILAGGSLFGILLVVPIFSSLLPASVLTLERSDRSSQFPACLPPTRLQIYLSKLIVIAVVVFFRPLQQNLCRRKGVWNRPETFSPPFSRSPVGEAPSPTSMSLRTWFQ